MAPGSATLTDRLDLLFAALDAAPAAPRTILTSVAFRQRYESTAMFAFRKLQAARYHHENVERFLASEAADLARAAERHGVAPGAAPPRRRSSVRVRRSAQPYAFELSAFLAAIKSGLDFLATLGALHLPGITADSIAVLMKQANKGVTGPILDEVAAAMAWLAAVRDYRHHLVHRLVLLPEAGWAVSTSEGAAAAARLPVVVPERTPAYVPDTRRARMSEEGVPRGVVERRSFASVTYADGAVEILGHDLAFEPAPGHVAIETFMATHLASFETFFASLVDGLIELGFKPSALSTAARAPT